MKFKDTMSLGELRKLTRDMPDEAVIMIVSEQMNDEALAVHPYPFCTSLDSQGPGVFLLQADTSDSVHFADC